MAVLKIIEQHHIPMLFKNQKIGDMILFWHHLKEWRKSHSISIQDIGADSAKTFSQCSSNSTSLPSPSEINQQEVTLSQIFNANKKTKQLTDYYNEIFSTVMSSSIIVNWYYLSLFWREFFAYVAVHKLSNWRANNTSFSNWEITILSYFQVRKNSYEIL